MNPNPHATWYVAQIASLKRWLDADLTRDANEYDQKLREYHSLRAELKTLK